MNDSFQYRYNHASTEVVAQHLELCDLGFIPALSSRVDIKEYAEKICENASRFEAWRGEALIGLVAAYCNDKINGIAFVTSVSVSPAWIRHGIASGLLGRCIEFASTSRMRQLQLEVGRENIAAISLYAKCGFSTHSAGTSFVTMKLDLKQEHA